MSQMQRFLCDAVRDGLAGAKCRPPEAVQHLWNAFQRLSATRSYHAAGPNPIQPTEILAWFQLIGWPLDRLRVDILLAMDQAWLEAAYRKQAPDGVKTLPPVSQHPLTAALFDVTAR